MDTKELEGLASQWARGQGARWVYPKGSPNAELVEAMIRQAREKIEGLGYSITTDDWGNVVIQMPFKV